MSYHTHTHTLPFTLILTPTCSHLHKNILVHSYTPIHTHSPMHTLAHSYTPLHTHSLSFSKTTHSLYLPLPSASAVTQHCSVDNKDSPNISPKIVKNKLTGDERQSFSLNLWIKEEEKAESLFCLHLTWRKLSIVDWTAANIPWDNQEPINLWNTSSHLIIILAQSKPSTLPAKRKNNCEEFENAWIIFLYFFFLHTCKRNIGLRMKNDTIQDSQQFS